MLTLAIRNLFLENTTINMTDQRHRLKLNIKHGFYQIYLSIIKKMLFTCVKRGQNKTYCLLFSIKTCYIVGPTNNCLFQCLFTHFYIHLHHCIFIWDEICGLFIVLKDQNLSVENLTLHALTLLGIIFRHIYIIHIYI